MTRITSMEQSPENSKNLVLNSDAFESLKTEITNDFWANLNAKGGLYLYFSSERLKKINDEINKNPSFSRKNHEELNLEIVNHVKSVAIKVFDQYKLPYSEANTFIKYNRNLIERIEVTVKEKGANLLLNFSYFKW